MPRRVRECVGLCVYAQGQDALEDFFGEGEEGGHREGGRRGESVGGVILGGGRGDIYPGTTIERMGLDDTNLLYCSKANPVYIETRFEFVSGPSIKIRYR